MTTCDFKWFFSILNNLFCANVYLVLFGILRFIFCLSFYRFFLPSIKRDCYRWEMSAQFVGTANMLYVICPLIYRESLLSCFHSTRPLLRVPLSPSRTLIGPSVWDPGGGPARGVFGATAGDHLGVTARPQHTTTATGSTCSCRHASMSKFRQTI